MITNIGCAMIDVLRIEYITETFGDPTLKRYKVCMYSGAEFEIREKTLPREKLIAVWLEALNFDRAFH